MLLQDLSSEIKPKAEKYENIDIKQEVEESEDITDTFSIDEVSILKGHVCLQYRKKSKCWYYLLAYIDIKGKPGKVKL